MDRQAPTMLSDAKEYHEQSTKFLLQWYVESEGQTLPPSLKAMRERVGYILNHPEKNPEFESPIGGGNDEMNQQNMKEWGIDPNSVDGRLLSLSDTVYGLSQDDEDKNRLSAEFRKQFDKYVYHFQWQPNTLLMINNKTLVHGRGPKPEGLSVPAWRLNEIGLHKTSIGDILNKKTDAGH